MPSGSASPRPSTGVPYLEPSVTSPTGGCGHFGFDDGEVGGYWSLGSEAPGCTGTNSFSNATIGDAYANETGHGGEGAGAYFFVGGPGIDPAYNGTVSEAYHWGVEQADALESEYVGHSDIVSSGLPVMLDAETRQGYDGWTHLYKDCSGTPTTPGPSAAVDRAVLNGMFQTLEPSYHVIVYSDPIGSWAAIFGSSTSGNIPNTSEWTAYAGKLCSNYAPLEWTQTYKTCGGTNSAQFFGGVTTSSSCAAMWQWDEGAEDYDQMDTTQLFACS